MLEFEDDFPVSLIISTGSHAVYPRPDHFQADSAIIFLLDGSHWVTTCNLVYVFNGPGMFPTIQRESVVIALCVIVLLCASGCDEATDPGTKTIESARPSTVNSLRDISLASRELSQQVGTSVVRVMARQDNDSNQRGDELRELFGPPSALPFEGQGSGVVVSPDGYIITNYHVIRRAQHVDVFADRPEPFPARVVGFDALTDLAVLKIERAGLTAIRWGDSDTLEVGDFVWAAGNPFGLERSISFGILSAKNRQGLTESFLNDFLQTDAAVNPGNSGGPLIDVHGDMVGINTAIIGQSYQGISFAIPSNVARRVFDDIRAAGKVQRGWIGVTLDAVNEQHARELGLKRAGGALVMAISQTSSPAPAAVAGLKSGDVIVTWNGTPVSNPITLARLIARCEVGTTADLTFVRDGAQRTVKVSIVERP